MRTLMELVLHLALVLVLAPLPGGVIRKIKAFVQKRQGPSLFQEYRDLRKLFRKDMVISDRASWVFSAAPFVVFGSSVAAAALVPLLPWAGGAEFPGDVFLVISLLALGRFFLALGGMDPGSTFGGMGSSREMMISALLEPAFLVFALALGLQAGGPSFGVILRHAATLGTAVWHPSFLLLLFSLILVTLGETARIPVDDPSTHLELTMVHEAMVLEYSGPFLALMEYGAAVKQLLFLTVLAQVFLPFGNAALAGMGIGGVVLGLPLAAAKVLVMAAAVGMAEVFTVKLRIFSVPNLAAMAFIAAFLGFLNLMVFGG